MMGVLLGAGTAVLVLQQYTQRATGAQGRGQVFAVGWDRGLTLIPDCSPSSHQQRRTSSSFTRSSSGGLCTGARAD